MDYCTTHLKYMKLRKKYLQNVCVLLEKSAFFYFCIKIFFSNIYLFFYRVFSITLFSFSPKIYNFKKRMRYLESSSGSSRSRLQCDYVLHKSIRQGLPSVHNVVCVCQLRNIERVYRRIDTSKTMRKSECKNFVKVQTNEHYYHIQNHIKKILKPIM